MKNTLPDDIARCNGDWLEDGVDSGWREGCETCLRRTAKRPEYYMMISPPAIIAFECEYLIEPVTPPSSKRRKALLSLLEEQ
jgi:hypothetical protein